LHASGTGFQALVDSVRRQEETSARFASNPTVNLSIHVSKEKMDIPVSLKEGQSLYEIFKNHETISAYAECACAGVAACSTCHVYVDNDSFEKLDPPEEAELDMLDLAWNPQPTSRLACQLNIKKEVEGMVLTIPDEVNNLF
jgi:2Fe-2S ferredoxin